MAQHTRRQSASSAESRSIRNARSAGTASNARSTTRLRMSGSDWVLTQRAADFGEQPISWRVGGRRRRLGG